MASPTPSQPVERPSIGEFSVRLSPLPAEDYRCPVSTPANFVQTHSRIRRTKPMVDIYSQPSTANARPHRSKGMALSQHSKSVRAASKVPLQVGNSLKYYFVDRQEDRKEEEHVNTHWLKALCSQPVDEILNKYRRKSDVRRTRIIWCKTFTTPGEKSLLSAWENNMFQTRAGGRNVKSAYFGGTRRTESSKRQMRQTQSEPPLSRAHNLDLLSGSISPVSAHKDFRTPRDTTADHIKLDLPESLRDNSPQKKMSITMPVKEFFSDDASGRVTTYVTQYFAPKGKGPMYAKVIRSPDLLPKLSSHHKISNMDNEKYNLTVSSVVSESVAVPQEHEESIANA